MTYPEFFTQLTGFQPNPFQERVAQALLADRNVILRAPTGSGKTWAAVAPFLYAIHCGKPIADRLLYALPLRSLATSLYESTHAAVSQCESMRSLAARVRIQTGERRDDPLFEGVATFTTIDQLLSGYLLHPVGLPSRLGNINAGALLGSLICFDEFHLLEPSKSMATAIEMLDTLAVANPLSRFVLMTATLSTETMKWLATKLQAELIEVPEEEVARLPSQIDKVRNYRWIDEPLSAMAVARVHGGKRSIVIANTVTRAQQLYEELNGTECRAILGERTQVRLLHSRFLARDRQRLESDLMEWFGPSPTVRDVVLVATQVVEAGQDFSCDNLHTEVAPMNAVVQRAGRCARRQKETGTVWCYALPVKESGKRTYGPYSDMAPLVDATATALQREVGESSATLKFHDELRLVNEVHTAWELQQLNQLNLYQHRSAIRTVMDHHDPSAVRRLVRDVSSINVVITDAPDTLEFNRRKWPEMLSVPPTSLLSLLNAKPSEDGWIAKAARETDLFEGGAIRMTWEEITTYGELLTAGWLVAIHPDFATYDPYMGLVVGRDGPAATVEYRDRPAQKRYTYRKEEYADHIRRVRSAGAKHGVDYVVATRRLASLLPVDEGCLDRWLDLVYSLHDVGKLSIQWQDAIWKWQIQKSGPCSERPPLAHSDYDPAVDWRKPSVPRPPHAAEGAYACAALLQNAFNPTQDELLWRAALTAITRHHGAFATSLTNFEFIPQVEGVVRKTLEELPLEGKLIDDPKLVHCERFGEYLIGATVPEQSRALLLYLYFVRRLRLADQNSFQEN